MTLSFLIILGSRNANIPFIVSAKITCSWIIIASFIYKVLSKMIVPDVTIGFVRAAEKERRGMLASAPAKPEMRITTVFFFF